MAKTAQRIIDRRGNVAAPDIKYTGQEPTWKDADEISYDEYNERLERGLRFYGYYCDSKICKEWLLNWMKNNEYSKDNLALIKSIMPTSIPLTIGKLCRMLNRGMPSEHRDEQKIYKEKLKQADEDEIVKKRPSRKDWVVDQLKEMIDENKDPFSILDDDVEDKVVKKKVSPHTLIKRKVNDEVISQLDALLDDIIKIEESTSPAKIPNIDVGRLMRGANVPTNGVKHIVVWINEHLKEFADAYNKTDSDMVEGYSWLRRPQLGRIKKNFEKMLDDAKVYSRNKVKTRKPRVKKAPTVDRQISRLKYLQNSEEFQLNSIDPSRLPFSQMALFFNTKYRQLSVYYARGASGLAIKGTTLQDFDKKKSFVISLRKPQDFLPLVLSSTPKKLEKVFSTLTTKPKKSNGRINANMIILRSLDTKPV